ncbi:MAG: hypothetical protein AB7G93_15315 [Bdellovibrionales bacterium]
MGKKSEMNAVTALFDVIPIHQEDLKAMIGERPKFLLEKLCIEQGDTELS